MAKALWVAGGEELISDVMGITLPPWKYYVKEATAALDALHGIVRVVPPEATGRMLIAAIEFMSDPDVYLAMAVEGDITQPKDTP